MATLQGQIWLDAEHSKRLMLDQIDLLQAIAETGSITAAAKSAGISYKTAWDKLDRLNNLSQEAIVARVAGGSSGGGSHLTEYGTKMLNGFKQLQEEHNLFLEGLGQRLKSLDDISTFMKSATLQTSARNQFLGVIAKLETGAVNTEVIIDVSNDQQIVAIVTEQSRSDMGLKVGSQVIALIKASSVTLAVGDGLNVSARNVVSGAISRLELGAVNTDVSMDLGESRSLSAVITNASATKLGLHDSMHVHAFFKASSVILMLP
ncbi:MAG: molybdenum-dependent transcriptional regulator [SAR86 cluster bacterium]|uniref:Molybdenum-dependent transcriptional regulator n=1 Tax=SAR86 cluster bacterium TaxID=2030880 RepID=A0A2A5B3F2_9GAMM|nr:MAG: molybdenum-dependent transcriptional regulator [SAR86 cluster bacterium]